MDLVKKDTVNIVDEFLSNFPKSATRTAYKRDISDFFGYYNARFGDPGILTINHFIAYRDQLLADGKAPATVGRKLSSLKSLMHWCVTRGFLQSNPVAHLKFPKVTTKYPTLAFTDDEVRRIFEAIDRTDLHGVVHTFILKILFNLGLRRSEIVNLKVSDIYEDRNFTVVKIIGKGDKERLLPLSPDMVLAYKEYLTAYEEVTGNKLENTDWLIQSNPWVKNANPMNSTTVFKIVRNYARKAGITKRVGAHSCRATVISHLLEKNISPRDVADFAGHTNIHTTISIYDKKRDFLENSAAMKVDYGSK